MLVALMAQKAEVKYDAAYILPSQIATEINNLGFNATVLEAEAAGHGVCELLVNKTIHPYICPHAYIHPSLHKYIHLSIHIFINSVA